MRDFAAEFTRSDDGVEWVETLEAFEEHWSLLRDALARRVQRMLTEFGDVDDLVDIVLDEVRRRCTRNLRTRPINRRFIYRTTTRVALSRRHRLCKRREILEARRRRVSLTANRPELLRRMDALRRIDHALMAVDGKERRVVFEILRQFRVRDTLSYEEMGRSLDCAEWKARVITARCFAKIRAYLESNPDRETGV